MSVTPDSFLNFAESAFTNAKDEFDHRNSASRAYYAAFHCCYLERKRGPGIPDNKLRGSHDILYDFFQSLPSNPESNLMKSMAYMAKIMKEVRRSADYYLNTDFPSDDSKQQLADARTVLRTWKKLQKDFP